MKYRDARDSKLLTHCSLLLFRLRHRTGLLDVLEAATGCIPNTGRVALPLHDSLTLGFVGCAPNLDGRLPLCCRAGEEAASDKQENGARNQVSLTMCNTSTLVRGQ